MPTLQFSPFTYGRPDYGLAEARLVNAYVEATPAGPTETARLPRPGLIADLNVGTGPCYGAFQQSGTFNGDRFVVSSTTLYRETLNLGDIAWSITPRFAASDTQLVVVSGGYAYCYDGATLARITDPDLPAVSDVVYLQGRFYYFQQDSDRIYFSDIGDATSIDGLAFLTAEDRPDASLGGLVVGDEIWAFGYSTIEPLSPTGDANAPLQRASGRTYQRGCVSQSSFVALDNTAFWVGDDGIAYRGGPIPLRVSTHGVEARIRACRSKNLIAGYVAAFDGHTFYVLNIPNQTTFAYDLSSQTWAEWASFGLTNFRANGSMNIGGNVYLPDAIDGTVWRMDADALTDGADPIERVTSCGALLTGGVQPCLSVMLQCVRGVGSNAAPDPTVELRYSDNAGRTWSDWDGRSLGPIGRYNDKAVWRRLGLMRSPGRSFEFRVTDPVVVVLESATYNEVFA